VRFNLDTFFGRIPIPLHFNYSVIDLDSVNYRYTVVGHPSRRLLWIMARDPFMDDAIYDQILIKVKSQGYDLSKIVKLQKSH
jgi:apolipoprotein D and lipocalin family protein